MNSSKISHSKWPRQVGIRLYICKVDLFNCKWRENERLLHTVCCLVFRVLIITFIERSQEVREKWRRRTKSPSDPRNLQLVARTLGLDQGEMDPSHWTGPRQLVGQDPTDLLQGFFTTFHYNFSFISLVSGQLGTFNFINIPFVKGRIVLAGLLDLKDCTEIKANTLIVSHNLYERIRRFLIAMIGGKKREWGLRSLDSRFLFSCRFHAGEKVVSTLDQIIRIYEKYYIITLRVLKPISPRNSVIFCSDNS